LRKWNSSKGQLQTETVWHLKTGLVDASDFEGEIAEEKKPSLGYAKLLVEVSGWLLDLMLC
jgi:hypothetical protein